MLVETTFSCPSCKQLIDIEQSRSIDYPQTESNHKAYGIERIIFCSQCDLGLSDPMLSDEQLTRLYDQGDYWKNDEVKCISIKENPGPYVMAEARWNFIKQYSSELTTYSILDIGAGHGFLGHIAAHDSEIKVDQYTMVESDNPLRSSFEQTWMENKNQTPMTAFSALDKVNTQHDIVVLSHILEHIPQPQEFIEAIKKRLKPNGLLFVDIPNQDYLFKPDVFPHVLFFSKTSLTAFLENCNFDVLAVKSFGQNKNASPNHAKNEKSSKNLIGKCVFKFRKFLPKKLVMQFFADYYAVNQSNDNGTWLRAMARVK